MSSKNSCTPRVTALGELLVVVLLVPGVYVSTGTWYPLGHAMYPALRVIMIESALSALSTVRLRLKIFLRKLEEKLKAPSHLKGMKQNQPK